MPHRAWEGPHAAHRKDKCFLRLAEKRGEKLVVFMEITTFAVELSYRRRREAAKDIKKHIYLTTYIYNK